MPGTYAPGDYDLAGLHRGRGGARARAHRRRRAGGRRALGLPSAGLHTNGYTLARKVLFDTLGYQVSTRLPELGHDRRARRSSRPTARTSPPSSRCSSGGRSAPSPTSRAAASRATSRASCPRAWARASAAGAWEVPPLFRLIQKGGGIADDEMFRTFNMGVGMIVVVAPEDLHDVEHSLERRGEARFVIGTVVEGAGVVFE